MYKNILLPMAIEEKSNTDKPLAIARALAGDGAVITLLHVFETPPSYVMQYVPEDLMRATRDGVLDSLQEAAEAVPGARAEIRNGSPGRTIADYADDHDIDLIVMASHRPSMGDILWGSTAAFVVKHVGCAVHVIR